MTNWMDLRTLAVIVFKFWRRAAIVFCLFILLGLAASVLIKRQYSSSSVMLVKIGRELVYRADVGSTSGVMESVDKDQLLASNIAIIKSQLLEEKVIQKIGIGRLYPDIAEESTRSATPWIESRLLEEVMSWLPNSPSPAPMTRALGRFDKKLSVDIIKKTGLIRVSFRHSDPEIAAQVTNEIVALFQQHVGDIYNNPNLVFEETRVRDMQSALDAAERKLSAYRLTHSVFDLSDQLSLMLKQRVDLESKLNDVSGQIVQLSGLTDALAGKIAGMPKSVPLYTETDRHRTADDAATQLMQLQVQERQLSTRFGPSYPQMAEIHNQIKAAQAAVAAQSEQGGSRSRTGVNDTRTALEQSLMQNSAQLQSLGGLRDTLRNQLATLNASITALSGTTPEVNLLQRDVDLRTAAVKTSYDKLVEARTVEGLNHEAPASFSVVEAAKPADLADPSQPLPLLYMLIAIAGGLVGSLVTIFLSFRMFEGFLTAKQVTIRLNRPVLAVIDYNRSLSSWKHNNSPPPRLIPMRANPRAV